MRTLTVGFAAMTAKLAVPSRCFSSCCGNDEACESERSSASLGSGECKQSVRASKLRDVSRSQPAVPADIKSRCLQLFRRKALPSDGRLPNFEGGRGTGRSVSTKRTQLGVALMVNGQVDIHGSGGCNGRAAPSSLQSLEFVEVS